MGRIPPLRPREVMAVLASPGFVDLQQRGSYKLFRQADGSGTTVPAHGGRDISPVLMRQIAKDMVSPQKNSSRFDRDELTSACCRRAIG